MRPIEYRVDTAYMQALKCVEFRLPRDPRLPRDEYLLSLGLRYGLAGAAATHQLLLSAGEDDEEPVGGFDPVVVAEGTEDLKSLSVASAVAELDLSGAPVIVFQHAGSGRVNVVYRRRDGAIGWLDPQAPREPTRGA